jgi:hypothetical protein
MGGDRIRGLSGSVGQRRRSKSPEHKYRPGTPDGQLPRAFAPSCNYGRRVFVTPPLPRSTEFWMKPTFSRVPQRRMELRRRE